MNLKNAKKIISAYKMACSDGVPPTCNFDWEPSQMGYRMADLSLACRIVGTSIEELQKESMPKKAEPIVAKKVVKVEPKKTVAKKVEPVAKKVETADMFKDSDKDGIPNYKDKDKDTTTAKTPNSKYSRKKSSTKNEKK